jgi:hypothetical protein
VMVALKPVTGQVKHDERQDQSTDNREEYLDSEGSLILRLWLRFAPFLLLTPAVMGEAPRLVHSQCCGREQKYDGDAGSPHEFSFKRDKIGTEQRFCRGTRYAPRSLPHDRELVHLQSAGGKNRQPEFHQNPVIPEKTPRCSERLK